MAGVHLLSENPTPERARNPRRPHRQFLPLHGLPAHRQRGAERRREEVGRAHDSCPPEARRPARQASRRPASDPGARHLRGRPEDCRACSTSRSSEATSRMAASRRSTSVLRRPWTASKLSYRRADRGVPRTDANRDPVPLTGASGRCHRRRPILLASQWRWSLPPIDMWLAMLRTRSSLPTIHSRRWLIPSWP